MIMFRPFFLNNFYVRLVKLNFMFILTCFFIIFVFRLNLLVFIVWFLFFSFFFIIFIPENNNKFLRIFSLWVTFYVFFFSLFLWIFFNNNKTGIQFYYYYEWIHFLNFNLTLGIDGISLFFILLTTFLVPICFLFSWTNITYRLKEYILLFLLLEILLILVFSIQDILLFYVCFESTLIPMFLIIGIWGSRERKIRAAYLLLIYTLIGSVLMLLAIIYIYVRVKSFSYISIWAYDFTFFEQRLLWLAFFASFASKVPMLPVHIWLPEAHVEAPTAGSVVLAGLLLKIGTYGFIRFSLPFFPEASLYFTPFIFTLSLLGILYTSLTAIRQTDMKRIIAYTSIAHMNLVVIGIFSFNILGLEGAILQGLSHGFVSSALFLLIGILYDRYHTKMIKYYSGLVHTMPIFTIIFLFFTMANIGLPGTSSFIGEFLLFLGALKISLSVAFFSALSMILGGCYSLWLFNRVVYGNLKIQYLNSQFQDINFREFIGLFSLLLIVILIGVYPEIFLESIHGSIQRLISLIN